MKYDKPILIEVSTTKNINQMQLEETVIMAIQITIIGVNKWPMLHKTATKHTFDRILDQIAFEEH